jgi:hypothetical protein
MAKYLQSCMEETSALLKRPDISQDVEDIAQYLLQKGNIKGLLFSYKRTVSQLLFSVLVLWHFY